MTWAEPLIWWRDNTEVRKIFENYLKIILSDWTNSSLVNYFLLLHCLRMVLIVSEFPNTNSAGRFYFVLNYSSDWSDNSYISVVIYFTTKIKLQTGQISRWHDHLQSWGNENNHISLLNPDHFLYKIFISSGEALGWNILWIDKISSRDWNRLIRYTPE